MPPLAEGPEGADSGDHVTAVEVAVAVIGEVEEHLLGGSLDPAGCVDEGALVLAERAQVEGLGVDDASGTVVGEGILWVLGPGLGSARVVVGGPGVRLSRRERRPDQSAASFPREYGLGYR